MKRLDEGRIAVKVGHYPELDLRVIGDQKDPAGARNETGSNGLAARGSYRNVLQIGLRGAQAPGGGSGLIEARVDASSLSVHPLRQGVDIGALELLQLTVLENETGKLVAHCRQLLQHVRVGGGTGLGLLEDRELELFEQDGRELPRRVQIQIGARGLSDLQLESPQIGAQFFAQPLKQFPVNGYALPFHI